MPTETITPTLVINKLTKAQYEGIVNPSDTELYLVPDDDLREHRSYYTTGTATVDGETVDVDIMYEGVAPEGSLETDAVWTITTIVATLDGNVLSNDVDTDQIWDFPTPTPVVPVIGTTPPICYPTTASEVGTNSMVVKSSVSDNGKIITERGFVYDTSPSPVITGNKLICDVGSGMMDGELDNLTQNTEYHIRSYGINGSGVNYGSELVQRTAYNPIPDEYQLVEYLQSSGAQYIDTGIMPNISTKFDVDVEFLSDNQNQNGCYSTSLDSGFIFGNLSDGLFIRVGNNSIRTNIIATNQRKSIIIEPYNNRVVIDSSIFQFTNTFTSINLNLYLFCRNTNNTASSYSVMKLYECKISINAGLSYNIKMYPVYRIADNKPGMYDIVNNVFYTNQGTGEFTVGPDKEWDE